MRSAREAVGEQNSSRGRSPGLDSNQWSEHSLGSARVLGVEPARAGAPSSLKRSIWGTAITGVRFLSAVTAVSVWRFLHERELANPSAASFADGWVNEIAYSTPSATG